MKTQKRRRLNVCVTRCKHPSRLFRHLDKEKSLSNKTHSCANPNTGTYNKHGATIAKISILAQQHNPVAANAYKQALRDSEEFWRIWHSLPDALPQKEALRVEYSEIMSLQNEVE